MNSKVYKWCAVPQCKNTSIRTPNKVFVHVPNKKNIRDKWLTLARRDPAGVVISSPIYFCEDHFDLPNDMVNYMRYRIVGSVAQVRMIPGCTPTKFGCQPDRNKRTCDGEERPYILKKKKLMAVEKWMNKSEKKNTSSLSLYASNINCNTIKERASEILCEQAEKSVQIMTLKRDIKENFDIHESQDYDSLNIHTHVEIKQEDLEDIDASKPNLSSASSSQTNSACGSPTRESHIETFTEYEHQNTIDVIATKEEPGSPLSDVVIHSHAADSPEEQAIELKLRKKIEMFSQNEEIIKRRRQEISILENNNKELLADIKYLQNVSKKKYNCFELN